MNYHNNDSESNRTIKPISSSEMIDPFDFLLYGIRVLTKDEKVSNGSQHVVLKAALSKLVSVSGRGKIPTWLWLSLILRCSRENIVSQAVIADKIVEVQNPADSKPPIELEHTLPRFLGPKGCSSSGELLPSQLVSLLSVTILSGKLSWLDDIRKAEALVALAGHKASRIIMKISEAKRLASCLGRFLVASSSTFYSQRDEKINGFSNQISGKGLDAQVWKDNDEVMIYLAKSFQWEIIAAALDASNGGGIVFGIPKCCSDWFKINWPDAVNRLNGDLGFKIFENRFGKSFGKISIPWETNSHAMYFGGGVTWHFPCSLSCSETIKLAGKRFEQVAELDFELAVRLAKMQKQSFILRADRHSFLVPEGAINLEFGNGLLVTPC